MTHALDYLDACGHDLGLDPIADEDLAYVVLSPEGDVAKIEAYGSLFSSPQPPAPLAPFALKGRQLWIPDKCREYGLTVVEVDGWPTRGGSTFDPKGTVCHHTAGSANGDMPTLRLLINGREDLPGPLCNVGLSRSGIVYVIASGRANHAGHGGYKGLKGNSSVLGIEAENTGREQWPVRQLDAYYALCAALQDGIKSNESYVCGHKEWAPTRKVDPYLLNMDMFRTQVGLVLREPEQDEEDEMRYIFFKRNDYGAVFMTTDDYRSFDGVHSVGDWNAIAEGARKAGAKVVGATGPELVVITPNQFAEFSKNLATPRTTSRGGLKTEWWKDLPELV